MAKGKSKADQKELLPDEAPGPVGKETFWPEGAKMPQHYLKIVEREKQPCPHCRRVTDRYGQQAATVLSSPADIVRLRCRCCGYVWQLPVKKAE